MRLNVAGLLLTARETGNTKKAYLQPWQAGLGGRFKGRKIVVFERGKEMRTMQNVFKTLIGLLAVGMLFQFMASAQAASDYPNKPIQIIVAWTAGASEDLRARSLVPKLQEVLGQPVVVVNKPGAAGTLGLTLVAKAKPDGYTLGSSPTSPILFAPHIQKMEYNPVTDFTFIAGTAIQPYAIVVRSDAPWKTMTELVDYVKNNPGKVKYGSFGLGGLAHVYMEKLSKDWNLNWVHIPFKGDQPNITALLGGHVPVAATSSAFVPHVKGGKLRVLVLLTAKRISAFPQVPTLKEMGFKLDLRGNEVLGFCGPKGLPPEIVKKLENAFKQAVESPENKQAMEQLDNEPRFRDSQTFTKLIQELYPEIGQVIKELGLAQSEK